MKFPALVLFLSVLTLWLSVEIGGYLRKSLPPLKGDQREDFNVVQTATMTLLALLIGFAFSMALNRYDLRKGYEEAEANAIGTEFVRADLLPPEDASRVRELLRQYVDQRVLFYTTRNGDRLHRIDEQTSRLQSEMWTVVQAAGTLRPIPTITLTISGMNDVLNSQSRTQGAWWNRIPIAAWILLALIAIGCNLLIGYGAYQKSVSLFIVLPLAVSISFFLISDIDSPRGGLIRVRPDNLISLSRSMQRTR